MANKPASLGATLIAKGQAVPVAPVSISPVLPSATSKRKSVEMAPGSADYYKALTVKLDRERYEALKTSGVALDKKSQAILVEALDLWLAKNQKVVNGN